MNKPELKEYLTKAFPSCTIEESYGFVTMRVPKEELLATALELKQNKETLFDFLVCLTAVDLQPDLEVVYHLRATTYHHSVVLKVTLTDRDKPAVDSVTSVWKAAEISECEVFDLFGIGFTGYDGLRRLFMPQDWPGFPLRKDYQDDNIITR